MSGQAVPDLLAALEAAGARLAVGEGGELALTGQRPPADLLAAVRARKADVLAYLTALAKAHPVPPSPSPGRGPGGGTGGPLTTLPEALVRLVQAAKVNGLNRPASLPSGIVANLGEYVLTCAALYACGLDSDRQLAHLWEARGAWAA